MYPWLLSLAILGLSLFLPARTDAATRPVYAIEATVGDDLSRIEGTLRARIPNDGVAPLETLILWLYPNLFAHPVAGVTDANRDYYQPFGKGPGGISIDRLEVDGIATEAREAPAAEAPRSTRFEIRLPRPLPPGESVAIEVDFVTTVPRRLGPLSRAHGVLTALGGWYPYFQPPTTRPLDRRPGPTDFRVRLAVPRGHVALVGGVRPTADLLVDLQGREWADLVVRPADVRPIRTQGGTVWPLKNRPGEEWENSALPNPPPLPSDWVGDELAQLLSRLARWADQQPEVPRRGPVQMVVVPLRSEIALATPGILAVSDRAFAVTPIPFLYRIHGRGIARAYLAHRFLGLVGGCESAGMTPQIADALGALYADRFAMEVLGTEADFDTAGLLGALDFIPSVDEFIRSPRSPFAHLYFQPVADPIAVRDEPWTFNNRAMRGKLLFAKLADWIGDQTLLDAVDTYLQAKGRACPFEEVASETSGIPLGVFFRAWTDALPREDLRIALQGTEPLPTGDFRTIVELRRIGDTPPETIEADVRDSAGHMQRLVWRAQEGDVSRRFEVVGPAPIVKARIDPRGRAIQTAANPGEIAAVGDQVPPPFQLLVTRFVVSFSTADRAVFGDVDILLRPREEVRRRIGFGASYRRARIQGRTSLSYGFGDLIDTTRYLWNGSVGLTADYLKAGFGSEATEPGFAVGPYGLITYDDRPPSISPLRGRVLVAGLAVDVGGQQGGATHVYTTSRLALLQLFPLGGEHALALRLKNNAILGEPPIQSLIPLGGSDDGLRGFPLEEVLAKQRAIASLEWRHPLLADIDMNLGLLRVRQISGAVFGDVAHASGIFPLVENTPESSWFADAGYGLRVHYDLVGVRPLMFSVDLAVPLNRFAGSRFPVTVNIGSSQAFSTP